jgi:DtxR family Mn-dependent transcriptional regulator
MRLVSASDGVRTLASLQAGATGVVHRVLHPHRDSSDRLLALGVTPGAAIRVLQTFPGIVFLCDQTELAVERGVAETVLVHLLEG